MAKRDDHFSLTQIARIAGKPTPTIQYAASRGKFGAPIVVGRRKVYPLAAVQRYCGRQITAGQIAAAREAPTQYVGEKSKAKVAEQRDSVRKKNADPTLRLVSLMLEIRDHDWVEYLAQHKIFGVKPPPKRSANV